ncbi:DUF4124 domain-containing protein [Pseudocolwellia sp. HL-MZ19]|uniref:DUF4124 domain-containing protein n=1 Tax=Pseudocolwellia sp. HL-MZ19 TaxID=3400846 RepID=UPI003CFB8FE2
MKYWSAGLLLAFSLNTFADGIIYRWVDESGIVHFTQHQPAVGDYTELTMANTHLSNTDKKDNTPKETKSLVSQPDKKETEASENLTIDTAKKCEEAKKNLATLSDFNRIRFVNADGETQVLDKEAQKEQLVINQERVALFCKK